MTYTPLSSANGYCSLTFHATKMQQQQNWVFAAISEGIKGWETSAFVFKALIPTVRVVLDSVLSKYAFRSEKNHSRGEQAIEMTSEELDRSIRKAFLDVDYGIITQAQDMILSSSSKALNAAQLSAGIAGSTGILAIYDETRRTLRIANVGDARAVLGRQAQREDGTPYIEVHVLSSEHIATNPSEQARLRDFHCGTNMNVLQKYIGRDITRAFGLAMCKWSQDVQDRIHRDYLGEPPLCDLLSENGSASPEEQMRPYLTAEPDITTIHVQPDDFLVMANKGLWDALTNEEVIGLVGLWLIKRNYNLRVPTLCPTEEDFVDRQMLPVNFPDNWQDTTTWYNRWKIPKRFICVDNNAGIHLIRNALGGANQAFTDGLARLPHPLSANSRYDTLINIMQNKK